MFKTQIFKKHQETTFTSVVIPAGLAEIREELLAEPRRGVKEKKSKGRRLYFVSVLYLFLLVNPCLLFMFIFP